MLSALLFLGIIFIYIPFMIIVEITKSCNNHPNSKPRPTYDELNKRRVQQVKKEDKLDNDFGVIEMDWGQITVRNG